MRIGIVAEPPRISSCFKITTEQARNLSSLGHELQIMVQERSFGKVLESFAGLDLSHVSVRKLRSVPLLSLGLQTFWNAYLLANPGNPDSWLGKGVDLGALIAHGALSPIWLKGNNFDAVLLETSFTAGYVLASLKGLSAKKVMYTHDAPMTSMAKLYWKLKGSSAVKKYESYVLDSCDEISSISRKIAIQWEEEFGIPSVVIHPGCNPSSFFRDEKDDFMLSVARWQPERQPKFLVEIMKKMRGSGLRLVVAGAWQDRELRSKFESQVLRENLSKEIKIVGRIPEEELLDLYRRARCLIYPTWNSFGFTALEAAAQGTPIVVPSGSAIWEMFDSGIHGFAVEANSIDSYVEAVSKFQDAGTGRRLGYQAWKRAKEHDWSQHARMLGRLLERA